MYICLHFKPAEASFENLLMTSSMSSHINLTLVIILTIFSAQRKAHTPIISQHIVYCSHSHFLSISNDVQYVKTTNIITHLKTNIYNIGNNFHQ